MTSDNVVSRSTQALSPSTPLPCWPLLASVFVFDRAALNASAVAGSGPFDLLSFCDQRKVSGQLILCEQFYMALTRGISDDHHHPARPEVYYCNYLGNH